MKYAQIKKMDNCVVCLIDGCYQVVSIVDCCVCPYTAAETWKVKRDGLDVMHGRHGSIQEWWIGCSSEYGLFVHQWCWCRCG